jgi:hypothetical protein
LVLINGQIRRQQAQANNRNLRASAPAAKTRSISSGSVEVIHSCSVVFAKGSLMKLRLPQHQDGGLVDLLTNNVGTASEGLARATTTPRSGKCCAGGNVVRNTSNTNIQIAKISDVGGSLRGSAFDSDSSSIGIQRAAIGSVLHLSETQIWIAASPLFCYLNCLERPPICHVRQGQASAGAGSADHNLSLHFQLPCQPQHPVASIASTPCNAELVVATGPSDSFTARPKALQLLLQPVHGLFPH